MARRSGCGASSSGHFAAHGGVTPAAGRHGFYLELPHDAPAAALVTDGGSAGVPSWLSVPPWYQAQDLENNATLIETTPGRTLKCASAITRPSREDVLSFFQKLRDVPGITVLSASLTRAPLDLDVLIEGVSYLSGRHPRSMRTILTQLSQANVRDKLVWQMLDAALQSMSMSSSFKQIEHALVSSPLVCGVAFLGHPVKGSTAIPGPDAATLGADGKPRTFDDLVVYHSHRLR